MVHVISPAFSIKVSVSYLGDHVIHSNPVETRHVLCFKPLVEYLVSVKAIEIKSEGFPNFFLVVLLVELVLKSVYL